MVRVYLLRRGSESLVAYLVDREPEDLTAAWERDGWEIVATTELPRPFPGARRLVVYA